MGEIFCSGVGCLALLAAFNRHLCAGFVRGSGVSVCCRDTVCGSSTPLRTLQSPHRESWAAEEAGGLGAKPPSQPGRCSELACAQPWTG